MKHILESINGIDRNPYEYILREYGGQNSPYTFIRYSDVSKEGIKPMGFGGLYGLGLYGITVDAFLGGYDIMQSAYNNEEVKYAIIYRPKYGSKVLYTDSYKHEDYKADLVKLFNTYGDNLIRFMAKSEERAPFRLLLEAASKIMQDGHDISIKHLMIGLGYDGIVDYKVSGSKAYPVQCVMYSLSSIDTIEIIPININRLISDYKNAVTIDKKYTAKKVSQLGDGTLY